MSVDLIAGRAIEACSECSSVESELQFPGRCWWARRVDEAEETDDHRFAVEEDEAIDPSAGTDARCRNG
jgi:hypothetical protein